jgi:hypothetical protein
VCSFLLLRVLHFAGARLSCESVLPLVTLVALLVRISHGFSDLRLRIHKDGGLVSIMDGCPFRHQGHRTATPTGRNIATQVQTEEAEEGEPRTIQLPFAVRVIVCISVVETRDSQAKELDEDDIEEPAGDRQFGIDERKEPEVVAPLASAPVVR